MRRQLMPPTQCNQCGKTFEEDEEYWTTGQYSHCLECSVKK